jgi:dTDP-4-dehydrorhamnose 3,5-epimerase-like enzyme
MNDELLHFSINDDERGSLVSLEELNNIPFTMKRVYYLYGLQKESSRGFHAHKELKQIIVCIKGSCNVVLDNGEKKQLFHLDKPNKGLFVDKMIWREMHDFSDDCILMVIASDYYDENDYIRNYHEFLK